jgi:glycine/D-amino acid oxidase-like deaminating enzyme
MQDPVTYDVIIAGGGIMGCSTAYYLLRAEPRIKVAVIEMDPTYSRASTSLSMANVRIQFSLNENILISRYTMEVLARFSEEMEVAGNQPDVSFRQEGNLFLVSEANRQAAMKMMVRQQELGCQVEWWSGDEIQRHYPLYQPGRFAGGTFGANDGYIDANTFLTGFLSKARSMGAVFINDRVGDLLIEKEGIKGVRLDSGEILHADAVVSCTGAWAAEVAKMAGIELPVIPVKRQVFVLHPAVQPPAPLPLTNFPSGLYFRTETGGLLLAGRSMADDPVGFELSWDEQRFVDHLWPELAELVPSFDRLKVVRGWAGLYAVNTFDGNAILGEWPELKGFYLANGFSGHGLQQAPAVGRYLAELIIGQQPVLNLSAFGPQRILERRRLCEMGLV